MEYQYILADGRLLYLSPQGHEEIQSLKLDAGEPFILKRIVGENQAVIWEAERIQTPAAQSPPMGPLENHLEHNNGSARKPPSISTHSITTGGKVPVPPSLTTRESVRIFNQLVATIQAAKAAEAFAESINYPVKFQPYDLRAMAISGFIEASKRSAA